jgi:hypothetical protein
MAKSLPFALAVGLLLGIAMVWWIEPDSNGAVFLVVTSIISCIAIGYVLRYVLRLDTKIGKKIPKETSK